MTIKEINEIYRHVSRLLGENMISAAISALENLIAHVGDFRYQEEIAEIRNTYSMMLHYFIEGVPDAKRREITVQLAARLDRLNDRLNYNALSMSMTSDYFSLVRSQQLASATIPQLLDQYDEALKKASISEAADVYSGKLYADLQEAVYRLFNKVWITQFLDKTATDALSARLSANSSDDTETSHSSILQSAILCSLYLGTMQYYDRAKVKLILTTLLNSQDCTVLARAYVLLVLLLARYSDTIGKDKSLKSLLTLVADNDSFHGIYKEIITDYIRSLDTARINKTIAEDIIPGLIKMRPDLEKAFRKMEHDLDSEESDYNPEWEEMLKKSGLEDKMRKLTDLQMEGGDMFMMAFAGIKKMAFFRNPANWLLPFSPLHTEINESVKRMPKEFTDMLTRGSIFCDSDCYSLFLGLKMMPESSFNMMASQIQQQVGQFDEDRMTSLKKEMQPKLEMHISRFFKDIYRFYHQYVNAAEFYNPFNHITDFASLPVAGRYIDNPEDLEFFGNLFFRRNLWKDTIVTFSHLERHYDDFLKASGDVKSPEYYLLYHYVPADETIESTLSCILEKKGYAQMRLHDYSGALDTLLNAQYYQEPSAWIMSRAADCLRNLGENALYGKFLDRALEIDSENKRLLLKRSRLFMESGEYEKSVGMFYKLNYLDPENLLYIRTLAWCRCLQSEPEKALELYNRIETKEQETSDLLNIGHCNFALGDYTEAVKSYTSYIALTDATQFIKALKEDTASLKFLQQHPTELAWTRDAALLRSSR